MHNYVPKKKHLELTQIINLISVWLQEHQKILINSPLREREKNEKENLNVFFSDLIKSLYNNYIL